MGWKHWFKRTCILRGTSKLNDSFLGSFQAQKEELDSWLEWNKIWQLFVKECLVNFNQDFLATTHVHLLAQTPHWWSCTKDLWSVQKGVFLSSLSIPDNLVGKYWKFCKDPVVGQSWFYQWFSIRVAYGKFWHLIVSTIYRPTNIFLQGKQMRKILDQPCFSREI